MADVYTKTIDRRAGRAIWSAIFSGLFVFLAVEVTFGVLGLAVFASSANPGAPRPVTGMSTGIGIWVVVLSIIALYFGGKTAGRLSGVAARLSGMYHGLVTFGLAIFSTVLMLSMVLGSTATGPAANVGRFGSATIADVVSTAGWWGFATLILGGIAAGLGGAHGAAGPSAGVAAIRNQTETRRVA